MIECKANYDRVTAPTGRLVVLNPCQSRVKAGPKQGQSRAYPYSVPNGASSLILRGLEALLGDPMGCVNGLRRALDMVWARCRGREGPWLAWKRFFIGMARSLGSLISQNIRANFRFGPFLSRIDDVTSRLVDCFRVPCIPVGREAGWQKSIRVLEF